MYAWGFVVICALLILMPVLMNTLTSHRMDWEPAEKKATSPANSRDLILEKAVRRRPYTSYDRAA